LDKYEIKTINLGKVMIWEEEPGSKRSTSVYAYDDELSPNLAR
jgi:hypothetical protein